MTRYLSDQERRNLDIRIAETEKKTGVQVVCAVVERCDTYNELPWKAFALGASFAGLGVVFLNLAKPEWASPVFPLLAIIATLAVGAGFALMCVGVPAVARLFLNAHTAEVEVRQYAESLFLSRELFATHARTAVLILISLFERRVLVLPDTGLAACLGGEVLQKIITDMTGALESGQVSKALEKGLDNLEHVLAATAADRSQVNEIPNAVIEEKGQ